MLLLLIVLELNIFQKEIKTFIKTFIDRSIVLANIFRIQTHDAIMCGYFCIELYDFMFAGKNLTYFTNLFA